MKLSGFTSFRFNPSTELRQAFLYPPPLSHTLIMDFKKFVLVIYIMAMVFYGFYCMILSITAYSKVKTIKDKYLSIVDNYKLDPISSIDATTAAGCISGEEKIFTYDWKGISNGCDCRSSTRFSGISTTLCNETQITYNCSHIYGVAGETFEYMRSNDGAVKFRVCIKRIPGFNFKSKHLSKDKPNCASGETKCNGQGLDFHYCTPSTPGTCPIVDL